MYGTHLRSEYSKTGYGRIRIAFNDISRNLLSIKRGDSISAAFVNAIVYKIDNFTFTFTSIPPTSQHNLTPSQHNPVFSL